MTKPKPIVTNILLALLAGTFGAVGGFYFHPAEVAPVITNVNSHQSDDTSQLIDACLGGKTLPNARWETYNYDNIGFVLTAPPDVLVTEDFESILFSPERERTKLSFITRVNIGIISVIVYDAPLTFEQFKSGYNQLDEEWGWIPVNVAGADDAAQRLGSVLIKRGNRFFVVTESANNPYGRNITCRERDRAVRQAIVATLRVFSPGTN